VTSTEHMDPQQMPHPDDILPPGMTRPDDNGVVSAMEQPELASQLSKEAIVGDRPQVADAPLGNVDLPGGWFAPSGERCTQALVRELTGRDEERLARINPTTNYPQFLQALVSAGLENINGFELSKEQLKELLIGDRESILLGIRIATYGPGVEMHIRCPACGAEEDLIVELDKDIPYREMATPEVREYDVELRGGRTAIVTPATVAVQDAIWDVKKSAAEMKTATLARCVRTIDGRPVAPGDILDLGLADRKTLINYLADLQPGPDYEGVRLPCESCGEEFPLALDLADLFQ
jgi:hypothetical protein